jgi:hypothetical protein
MGHIFAPYRGNSPAALTINGHRLIILSYERGELEPHLDLVGADRVRRVKSGETDEEQEVVLQKLAKRVKGGIVIMPPDVAFGEVLRSLQDQLPWVQ